MSTRKQLGWPYLAPLRRVITLGVIAVTLSACGGGKWGFPYRIDVQQGNWVTASQVEQLEIGMTREQVRFVLGTPTLQDIFYSDRWEYPYYFKPGYGQDELRTFTVWFDGDQLTRWEGSKQPDRQPFERADSGAADDAQDAEQTQTDTEATQAAEGSAAQPATPPPSPAATPSEVTDGPVSSPILVDNPPMPVPTDSAPADQPAAGQPTDTVPSVEGSIGAGQTDIDPIDDAPMGNSSIGNVPAGDAPTTNKSIGDIPTNTNPMGDAPTTDMQ